MHKDHRGRAICPFTGREFSFYRAVFTREEDALSYLQSQNPKLVQILKDFPAQVVNKRPGHFIESFITRWRVGPLGVLVGDAGSCAPPWAGFGMNLACSHAADLAQLIGQLGDLDTALEQYNTGQQKCTEVVKDLIRTHGVLLNSGIGLGKWRRDQGLRERREQMLGERSPYQIVAFEEGGLEHLAGLE
jgi:2-polyprenyl-6-methoxyphenol hydroxylase-like FAD-dependent oxidoreductase